jgi:hypothetical protein
MGKNPKTPSTLRKSAEAAEKKLHASSFSIPERQLAAALC